MSKEAATSNQNHKDPPDTIKNQPLPPPNELHVVTEDGEQCFMWRSNQLTYIAPNRKELPPVLAKKFGHLATKLDLSYNNLTSFRNINLFTNLNELILDNNCLEDDQLDFRQNLRLKTLSLNKNKLCDLFKLIISIKVCFPNLEYLSLIGNQFYPIKITTTTTTTDAARSITTVATRSLLTRQFETSTGPVCGNSAAATSNANASTSLSVYKNNYGKQLTKISQPVVDPSDSNRLFDDDDTDFNNQNYRYFIINHLPNLNFLDSNPIGSRERDEALNCCFWLEHFTDRFGRQRPLICGQTGMQSDQNGPTYSGHSIKSYNNIIIDNGSLNTTTSSSYQYNSISLPPVVQHREAISMEKQHQQLQLVTANGFEHQPKGQLFSQQVKCQMVGGFTFARTLIWTLISLTSTNLVHCSMGALLALSYKGTGKIRQKEEVKKKRSNS